MSGSFQCQQELAGRHGDRNVRSGQPTASLRQEFVNQIRQSLYELRIGTRGVIAENREHFFE